ncbi:MAG: oligosaccharide flippase family protein [Anaerolineales bacterium]|nr:oligosaccharide flippase family protein [Anaerolineales bacterium]
MLKRFQLDLLVAGLLLLLPLILFWPVTAGDRTLIPADALTAVEPYRSAAAQFNLAGPPQNALLQDLVLENYLWKKFILESIQARELPLWNPYIFSGVPFLAAGQHSALYPFALIYYVFPLPRAYGVFTVSQLFIAGLFMYLFLRVLGLRRAGAALGAILYQLCGFMVVSVVFQMIIAAAAWLPLILTMIELLARQQPALGGRPASVPWLVLGAGALGLQILAGHVEITYYTLLVSGAYAAWRLGGLWWAARRDPAQRPGALALVLRRGAAMLALALLGLALAAIQFVPLFELASTSFRTGRATFDEIVGWAFPWRHALVYLIPNFYGNPSHHSYFDLFTGAWTPATVNLQGQPADTIVWGVKNYVEGGTYLGLLPLLLAAYTAWRWLRRNRRPLDHPITQSPAFQTSVPFFLLLAFFSLAFAFPTRLYALIFWLPGLNQLHSAFRWVWPLTLAVAVLAAYGVELLQAERPPGSKERAAADGQQKPSLARGPWAVIWLGAEPSFAALLASLSVWGGAGVLTGLAFIRWRYDLFAAFMDRLVRELALAENAFRDGRMFFSYTAGWTALFAGTLIAAGLVLRLSRGRWTWRPAGRGTGGRLVWPFLALGVLAVDLLAAGWGFNPAVDPALLSYTPPSAAFLQQDTGLWRFTSYDPAGQKPYNANIGWFFNFQDVRGYDSLFSRQYADYMTLIQPQYELDYNRIAPISTSTALDSPLLDLLNVKYVVSLADIPNPKFTRVYSGEVQIYQNLAVMPRAYLLPQTATLAVDDLAQAVQQFDPRQYVMVAPADALGVAFALPAAAVPAAVTGYTPNEVFVEAEAAEPSWLVLNDAFFPGWKAFLRPRGAPDNTEQELTIARVNGNFRGVTVPAGAWTVRFKYSPVSVRLGGLGSLVAGVTLVFLLGVWVWRYFYQESKIDSTARRIAKNSVAPMALNLMNRGLDLVFAVFMLRVLGPADTGKYYFAVVIFGWFAILTNYGLDTFLTREVSRDRAHANRYLINTTVLRLLLGLVVMPGLAALLLARQALPAVTLPFGLGVLAPEPLSADTLWAIGLLVLAQAPATVAAGFSALFYVYEKAEYPAAVTTVTTLIRITLSTIALVLGWGIVGLAGTSMIVNVITLAILGVLVWRNFFRPHWELDWGLQRGAARESFPLMLNNLLATLFFKVDVTLLEPLRNFTEVGWYSAGYKFIDAYNVVPSLFTFALFPVLARQAHQPDQRTTVRYTYGFAVKVLVTLALPLAVVNTFLATPLVGLLGGAEFLPHGATALVLLAWSMPFGWINSVTNYVLIAAGQQRGLTRAFAAALIFNVVGNLLVIPGYGFAGAAAMTIASEIFEGLLFYYYFRRSLGGVPWLKWLWRPWLGAGLMAAITAALWWFQPILALLAGGAVYLTVMVGLQAFNPEERATLVGILPSGLRRRLSPPPDESHP